MGKLSDRLYKAETVGLFGLGISNLGVLDFIRGMGKRLIIRSEKALRPEDIPEWARGAKVLTGKEALDDICEDVLFLSPSVKRGRHELARAAAGGTLMLSDAELFLELVSGRVFAVTGSDGKSTTCEIAHRLLMSRDEGARLSGNCGASMLGALKGDTPSGTHIVELSSFMLEYMRPRVYRSVITCISENHLDWHESFDNYIRAKTNILECAKECALWYDDEISRGAAAVYKPRILISELYTAKELAGYCDTAITLEGGAICENGMPLLKVTDIKRCEPHNIKNFMSAMALCRGRYDKEALADIARGFSGVSHRCESLGMIGGVEYIDSSIDSTPARTRITLEGLGRRVILILGGRGKGLSYSPLCEPVCKYCEAVVICGENAEEINSCLAHDARMSSMVPIYRADSFDGAVRLAGELASKCRLVLLSPASTSYNEFKNFEERAEVFKKIISN